MIRELLYITYLGINTARVKVACAVLGHQLENKGNGWFRCRRCGNYPMRPNVAQDQAINEKLQRERGEGK